jgi:hypothetical protein
MGARDEGVLVSKNLVDDARVVGSLHLELVVLAWVPQLDAHVSRGGHEEASTHGLVQGMRVEFGQDQRVRG